MIEQKNLRDSFAFYKNSVETPVLDIRIYMSIVLGFIQFIMRRVFEGNDVRLSVNQSLGTIAVRGTKITPRINEEGRITKLAPDWGATKKLWACNPEAKEKKEVLYCFNEHTNGIRYRIVWYLQGIKVPNKSLYSLIFSKGVNGNKRLLSKHIKQGKEYALITNKINNHG